MVTPHTQRVGRSSWRSTHKHAGSPRPLGCPAFSSFLGSDARSVLSCRAGIASTGHIHRGGREAFSPTPLKPRPCFFLPSLLPPEAKRQRLPPKREKEQKRKRTPPPTHTQSFQSTERKADGGRSRWKPKTLRKRKKRQNDSHSLPVHPPPPPKKNPAHLQS